MIICHCQFIFTQTVKKSLRKRKTCAKTLLVNFNNWKESRFCFLAWCICFIFLSFFFLYEALRHWMVLRGKTFKGKTWQGHNYVFNELCTGCTEKKNIRLVTFVLFFCIPPIEAANSGSDFWCSCVQGACTAYVWKTICMLLCCLPFVWHVI
jgi:hypothetical protein